MYKLLIPPGFSFYAKYRVTLSYSHSNPIFLIQAKWCCNRYGLWQCIVQYPYESAQRCFPSISIVTSPLNSTFFLDPYKHHKSSSITHQAPPLTDPFGFHLTLQRDPVSQRLAAALWMSPHSTLCGDEIHAERLEFVVPSMRWEEEKWWKYWIDESMWLPRGVSEHTSCDGGDCFLQERRYWSTVYYSQLYLVRMPASFN